MKKFAVLVAGGTGGHINAALAVGEALTEKKFDVLYLTGKRLLDYKLFKDHNVIHLDSKPLRTKNPIRLIRNILENLISFIRIFFFFMNKRPRFIIGAGGYVCGPTLLAGFLQGIPVYIIEQNAVMGLTNKILGWFSRKIFVHFSETKGLSPRLEKKVVTVGNPTRKSIRPVSKKIMDEKLNVLVFGGSLGAEQINRAIFKSLESSIASRLRIHHQVGPKYKLPEINTTAEYQALEYIDDMQREYEWCDVIISRSGASTISELAIIKKPTLIFPYPQATDNHQYYNALIFKSESEFSVEILDPNIETKQAAESVNEFFSKALNGNLEYSNIPHSGNKTCESILREVFNDSGTY